MQQPPTWLAVQSQATREGQPRVQPAPHQLAMPKSQPPHPPEAGVDGVGDEARGIVPPPLAGEQAPPTPAGEAGATSAPPSATGEASGPSATSTHPLEAKVGGAGGLLRVANPPSAGDEVKRPPPTVGAEGEAGVTGSRELPSGSRTSGSPPSHWRTPRMSKKTGWVNRRAATWTSV